MSAHSADDVAAIKAVAAALWGTDPYLGWANIARITIEALRDAGFEVRRIDGSGVRTPTRELDGDEEFAEKVQNPPGP